MPLRTAEQYVDALRDGRTVFYKGKAVGDVTAEPELRVAVDHAALDYRLAEDPRHTELAVATDPDSGERYNAYYRIPRSAEDLLARSQLIAATTAAGGTLVTLIREIGSDALFALQRVLDGEELGRAEAYWRHCRDNDLAVAVAQSDVKGDRALGPHEQADPDLYVRVVDEDANGVVVRGAKVHTSVSANADEIIVVPTRAMGADDAAYAVAFAVPVATEGLSLYVSSYGAGERDELEFPLSSRHKMLETLTVFEDVFVPWERVFACRKPEVAGPLALTFVEYHRFTAVSYKLPLLDALVGSAIAIAEMNGVGRAGHVRDKVARLITYSETVRGLTELAALRCRLGRRGIAYPDPLTTNMAKFNFATGLPRGDRARPGLRRRPPRDWLRRRRLGQPRRAARAREVPRRQVAGRGEDADDAPDLRPHGARLRRLPRRVGGARRGVDRGGEAADPPLLRSRPGDVVRAPAGGDRLSGAPVTAEQPSLYERVGGREWFVALVDRFYDAIATEPLVRPMYPDDLSGPRQRLSLFLIQYWGGPSDYEELRGHPRLRLRHRDFAIGHAERKAWLEHMSAAVRAGGSRARTRRS